ncbi:electron transfer flavoprotein subunit alpha/FixB family protein [Fulvimarina sp. 2208YS6-2-32]|uniref:Electron transfer flavoprotein subunit alpha/FixB family protein n=1 Tax=Fulvimarina uroteuthidis TaxID=3098149 RepID=A0ABU5I4K1_9HYPH|nr:electron transfer flavoprotein subunit alpha/FixB family protein [Fulvimarina sp. 2208YS6-2-32]MDY8110020.1 electron transfer flavoprotein subunit alpha/FixB family protein [Fulvimarina sp. 2208YS6-2-32]
MTRTRRDPRSEREARSVGGRHRPRFDLGLAVGASRRPRRDPRAERRGFEVFAAPRLRLDRTQTLAPIPAGPGDAPSRRSEAAAPAVRVVAAPAYLVFAVLEAAKGRLSRLDRQVLGAARLLADAGEGGGAVVGIAPAGIVDLGACGADRVLAMTGDGEMSAPARAARIRAMVEALAPRHVIFAEDGEGADLARRIAVSLRETILTDLVSLSARQAVRARDGNRTEMFGAPPRFITIGEDRVAAYGGVPCEARALDGDFNAGRSADPAILSIEPVAGDPSALSLSETDFVVSAGNGVTDIEAFKALAAALSGTPGASRVVCDAGLMPRSAQVGASGTVLAADCYLALGIAGAPQHLQGIAACEHVIAVNTDLHAKMVERAGLAIVADAQAVMPALKALVDERKRRAR